MPRIDKVAEAAYQKEWHKNWYADPENAANRRKQIAERRSELYDWYREYKLTLSCALCGFSHPAAMDFHHRDPNAKEITISKLINNGAGMKKILAEISKCDVLCSNCHRIVHFDERSQGSSNGSDTTL